MFTPRSLKKLDLAQVSLLRLLNDLLLNAVYVCILNIMVRVVKAYASCCVIQIDAHSDTLISEQASVILGHCGLAQLYGIAQQHQPQQVGRFTPCS